MDASVNPLFRLPEGFTQLIALKELFLNDTFLVCCSLDFPNVPLDSLFFNTSLLKWLDFSLVLTRFTTLQEYLPANFGRLVCLEVLELRDNQLNTLPKSLVRLTKLRRLDIGSNEFSQLVSCGHMSNTVVSLPVIYSQQKYHKTTSVTNPCFLFSLFMVIKFLLDSFFLCPFSFLFPFPFFLFFPPLNP